MSLAASSRALALGCLLSFCAIAPAVAQPPSLSLVKAPVSMSIIPVVDDVDCFREQGNCEGRCTSAGVNLNACFQQCQEEKDRCDAEQHQ